MNDPLPMAAGDPGKTVWQGDVEVPKDLGALGVSGQEKEATLVRPSCTGHDSSSGCQQGTPEGPRVTAQQTWPPPSRTVAAERRGNLKD